MRDSMHIYQTKHARQCFSTLSDSQISAWQARGLVAHEALQKSIRRMFRYSALQIVHLGVLSQLSLLGILARAEHTNVYDPDRHWFTLKEAFKLVDCYYEYGPDIVLTAMLAEMPIETEDQRLRSSRTEPRILIIRSSELTDWIQTYRGGGGLIGVEMEKWMHNLDDASPADWFKSFGFIMIDVERIILHVYETLEITRFLK